MFSIIQAAGWPIWPLIACSILALALIVERFLALKTAKVVPPNLLQEAISVSSTSVPSAEVVNQLGQNSALGEVLASGLRAINSEPRISEADLRATMESEVAQAEARAEAQAIQSELQTQTLRMMTLAMVLHYGLRAWSLQR